MREILETQKKHIQTTYARHENMDDRQLRLNYGDDKRCCVNDGIKEFPAQPRTLFFIPANGCSKLFAGFFDVSECPRHRPRRSFAIRRFTVSHDSSLAVPASSSFTRRSISFSQAAAAS